MAFGRLTICKTPVQDVSPEAVLHYPTRHPITIMPTQPRRDVPVGRKRSRSRPLRKQPLSTIVWIMSPMILLMITRKMTTISSQMLPASLPTIWPTGWPVFMFLKWEINRNPSMIPRQLNTAARAQTAPSGCTSKYQQFLPTRMRGMEEDAADRGTLYTLLYSDISIRRHT